MGWFDHQLDKPSGLAAEWPSIRDTAVQRCAAQTWPAVHGDHPLVLLEFIGGGYGAMVAAAWVMRKVGKVFFVEANHKGSTLLHYLFDGLVGREYNYS